MAEIKSTLELALERTRGMEISREERAKIKRKESLQKATTLFHRYLEDRISLNDILREMAAMEEGARESLRAILLSQWIDALSLSQEYEKLLKGIEALKGCSLDTFRERFDRLLTQYEEEKHRMEEKIRFEQLEALRREGISGSAVVLRVTESDAWAGWVKVQERSYGEKIEELKKALRAS
jgi:hypothetical protein